MNPIYPPETSLIPTTVALTRFFEEQGPLAFTQNYPFWYLGSTPYRFLIGPVFPLFSSLVHKLLPDVSLFNISIYLIIFSFLLSALGWGKVIQKLSTKGGSSSGGQNPKSKFQKFGIGHLAFVILLLILPWRYFSAIAIGEASLTIARNLLPFALLTLWPYLKKKNLASAIWGVAAISLILLINISILPILLVGVASIILAVSFRKGKFRRVFKNLKSSLLIITYSLLVVTLWYTPSYWWTLLTNPSIGGASGIKVILRIFDILRAGLPLFLAIIAVYFSGKVKRRLTVFNLIWLLTFGFLTLFRFIGDPDFWMDWTSWLCELEIGVALVIASNFQFPISNFQLNQNSKNQKLVTYYLLLITLFLLPFYFVWRIHLALGKPALLSKEIPVGVRSLEKLNELINKEGLPANELQHEPFTNNNEKASDKIGRVFLSGSTVFWAGSTGSPLIQVRGGKDEVATHPFWHHAAYQIREGDSPELAKDWLKSLNVTWVLVHTEISQEYYQDFRNIDKWNMVGRLVWEGNGDKIYKISE